MLSNLSMNIFFIYFLSMKFVNVNKAKYTILIFSKKGNRMGAITYIPKI